MRKLILLILAGAAAAYYARSRGQDSAPASDWTATATATPSPPPAGEAVAPETAETAESDAVVMPDTSADDPLVREQENAARAAAGAIGGEADSVSAEADPEMRPVVEGSGDSEETFETTEDQGR
ncbi:MAG TPA: hypothetical protein VF545_06005 [Thermoleophilaceae bacterium]|jgi:hypothetical protein